MASSNDGAIAGHRGVMVLDRRHVMVRRRRISPRQTNSRYRLAWNLFACNCSPPYRMSGHHSTSTIAATTVCDLRRQLSIVNCDWLQPESAPPCRRAKRRLRRSILVVSVPHGLCLFQADATVWPTTVPPLAIHSSGIRPPRCSNLRYH